MITVTIDISSIKNEITQLHQTLHETYNMTDSQRRDAVNRLVEKVRTLKTLLETSQITATVK